MERTHLIHGGHFHILVKGDKGAGDPLPLEIIVDCSVWLVNVYLVVPYYHAAMDIHLGKCGTYKVRNDRFQHLACIFQEPSSLVLGRTELTASSLHRDFHRVHVGIEAIRYEGLAGTK